MDVTDGLCTISGSEAVHIIKVLRMIPGDRLMLMDGTGNLYQALIKTVEGKQLVVAIEKLMPPSPSSPVRIILCQALLKSRAMDGVVRSTSELGVDGIVPFSSERTVVNLTEDRFRARARHWREIALNAAKQSCRRKPAQIASLHTLESVISQWEEEGDLKVILWEEEGAQDLKTLLRAAPRRKTFVGIVGPEGGFETGEIHAATKAGFVSVSLGRRKLRASTAAISMVAIVQYEWGDLSLSH